MNKFAEAEARIAKIFDAETPPKVTEERVLEKAATI